MNGGLWEFISIFFWSFVFISYLFALFAIIGDLFRDTSLNGWGKAVWIIFLVFVPFLTALVYLIARGRGMAERSQREAMQVRHDMDTHIREVSGAASPAEEIAKAKALMDSGAITPQEFADLKARALAGAAGAPAAPAQAGPTAPVA